MVPDRMARDRATYVYCLVQDDAPELDGAPPGLEGAGAPRLLPAGAALWLVVADAPLDRYGAAAIERRLRDVEWVSGCAIAHEALVEHFLACDAVLPMKLFTLFSSDERALADLGARRSALEPILEAVRGRHEWGLRVLHDVERARRVLRERGAPPNPGGTGTDFLMRKKAERDAAKRAAGEGRERADELYSALAARTSAAQRRDDAAGGPGKLVLDATFLVPATDEEDFRALVRERAAALEASGFELLLTGPWPPYHFVGGAT